MNIHSKMVSAKIDLRIHFAKLCVPNDVGDREEMMGRRANQSIYDILHIIPALITSMTIDKKCSAIDI